MKWLEVKTLKELKQLGSYKDVRQDIKNSLGERLYFKSRGW